MTSFWMRFKRITYLVHRWTGVGACVLMAIWFLSGMVMLFVGYPKLLPAERLAALPVLSAAECCVPVEAALAQAEKPTDVREIQLTAQGGQPYYRLLQSDGKYVTVNARTGLRSTTITKDEAVLAARTYEEQASGRRDSTGGPIKPIAERKKAQPPQNTDASWLGLTQEDRWTHSGRLNAHRPLHRVQLEDPAHTLLYVSSSTGEVVMDAPRAERVWNYVGAWLHWLYMFRNQPSDPTWTWLVIILSAVGVITAVSGTFVGLWRWRFSHPYKSGSHSPYRDGWMRWHHLAGLLFAATTCTWIFSGLMSMNPVGVFNPQHARPDIAAWRGTTPGQQRLALQAPDALSLLAREGFYARQLEWRVLNKQPYLLARDAGNHVRLIVHEGDGYTVRKQWPQSVLIAGVHHLLKAPVEAVSSLSNYDAYYFHRAPASMYGADDRRLPVLRVVFKDADATWVYIDPHTGDIEQSLSRRQRVGRWLFNLLHSWDFQPMLKAELTRNIALILLSIGGLAMSVTGVWIGYIRLRRKLMMG
ncbi:PepSY domain-containing protein [Allopusillimonas ginsengisoli]|uniref:PepSY domain-containing protein n=1 Tax=Allopusillimonas ginsengisoli TaxID=453575 RepID=UPI0010C1CDDC|nr:PepSY domain-containing protein [Allopusillimonas ginsengisoli]